MPGTIIALNSSKDQLIYGYAIVVPVELLTKIDIAQVIDDDIKKTSVIDPANYSKVIESQANLKDSPKDLAWRMFLFLCLVAFIMLIGFLLFALIKIDEFKNGPR